MEILNRRGRMFSLTRTMSCLIILSVVAGCGGAPTPMKQSTELNPPGPSLTALINQKMVAAKHPAVVTFAVFDGGELADEKMLKRQLATFLTERKRRGKEIPSPSELIVVSHSMSDSLPFNLDGLIASASKHAKTIRTSNYVTFVRYKGPSLKAHAQVRIVLDFIQTLPKTSDQTIVDFSTRRDYDRATFDTWVMSDPALADQVVPGIEKSSTGVTMFTRGFAKFGLPDLELYDVPPSEARKTFADFQMAIQAHRNQRSRSIGDTLLNFQFSPCKRDAASYESQCVRLTPK